MKLDTDPQVIQSNVAEALMSAVGSTVSSEMKKVSAVKFKDESRSRASRDLSESLPSYSRLKKRFKEKALGGLIQQFGIGGDVVSTVGKTKGKTLEQALHLSNQHIAF